MEKYLKLPLWFLFIGATLGFLLRLHVVYPIPGVSYGNVLHGHSHIMFLGWVFNALYLALTTNYIRRKDQGIYKTLFIVLQLFTVGMLFSFPMQGYGTVSVILSALHTVVAFIFIAIFFKGVQSNSSTSAWYAKSSLLFFVVSSLGPFLLGYLKANDLGASHWYNYAIYYYLHFQYNGFFFFGIAALFLHMMEQTDPDSTRELKRPGKILIIATLLTYFLSILYSQPGVVFNIIGAIGAALQVIVLLMWVRFINKNTFRVRQIFPNSVKPFLSVIWISAGLKVILQLISALPAAAILAYESRSIVIAYLHLVLIGIVSLFLLVYYYSRQSNTSPVVIASLWTFGLSFVAMEIVLVAIPWWGKVGGNALHHVHALILISFLLIMCTLVLALAKCTKRNSHG